MVTWGLIGRNELALISLHGYTPAGVGARLDFFSLLGYFSVAIFGKHGIFLAERQELTRGAGVQHCPYTMSLDGTL